MYGLANKCDVIISEDFYNFLLYWLVFSLSVVSENTLRVLTLGICRARLQDDNHKCDTALGVEDNIRYTFINPCGEGNPQ